MPKKAAPQPPAPADLPPCDPATICPTISYGGRIIPDMANHRASRVVTKAESTARGWSMHWTGAPCRYGHAAARWNSNPHRCSDCERIKQGKEPVYDKAPQGSHYPEPRRKSKDQTPPVVAFAPAPLTQAEPDRADKRFLEAYAEHRNVEKAALAVGTTVAFVESRRACNLIFATAMQQLEERLMIPRTVLPPPTEFSWTPEIESRLIRLWIDTGDIAIARDSVGVTASQFFKHSEESRDFNAAVERARPLAALALEDRAVQLSLAGNDRLLSLILKAEFPDRYTDKLNINMRSDKLTDDEIANRIAHLCDKLGVRIVTKGAVIDVEPIRDADFTPTAKAQLAHESGASTTADVARAERQSAHAAEPSRSTDTGGNSDLV